MYTAGDTARSARLIRNQRKVSSCQGPLWQGQQPQFRNVYSTFTHSTLTSSRQLILSFNDSFRRDTSVVPVETLPVISGSM